MKYEKNRKLAGVDEFQLRKFMRFLALPLIALVLIIVILAADLPKRMKERGEAGTTAAAVESGAAAPETTMYDYANAAPERSANAEINALVSEYLDARLNGDAEKMCRVFGRDSETSAEAMREQLHKEAKLYSSFENTLNYVVPGVDSDSWIVYVSTSAWFSKVDTPAPMLFRAYVARDGEGKLYIKEDALLTPEEGEAAALADSSPAVRKLNSETRTALAKAVVSDARLGSVYERLKEGGTEPETAPDTTPAAEESVAEAVVEIGGESAAESPAEGAEAGAEAGAGAGDASEGGAAESGSAAAAESVSEAEISVETSPAGT